MADLLKLTWYSKDHIQKTWLIGDNVQTTIGRDSECSIVLEDNMCSDIHAVIRGVHISDNGSVNGVIINNKYIQPSGTKKDTNNNEYKDSPQIELKHGDEIICGETILCVRKRLIGDINSASSVGQDMDELSVEEYMELKFSKIIGQELIKEQLRKFYKQAQIEKIRRSYIEETREGNPEKYHMLFMGPPGTGKTTMAYLVAGIMLKMGILQNDNVVMVANPLELLGQFQGAGPKNVAQKVKEAKGGILFVDEAYSLIKKGSDNKYGIEVITSFMQWMDPAATTFIFAGYVEEMEEFLDQNAGLERRIKYRYIFKPYTVQELTDIILIMTKKEELESDAESVIKRLLMKIPVARRENENGGIAGNFIEFTKAARNKRLNLNVIENDPSILFSLLNVDFEQGMFDYLAQASTK